MRDMALVALIATGILVIGCATITSVAEMQVRAELTQLFPLASEELIETLAQRIVGIGAESLSYLCNDACAAMLPEDVALCTLVCSEPARGNMRVPSVSSEADVFLPRIVQDE